MSTATIRLLTCLTRARAHTHLQASQSPCCFPSIPDASSRAHTHLQASQSPCCFPSIPDASAPEPCGQRPPYRGYDPYGFGSVSNTLPGRGFFPLGLRLPRRLVGLALMQVTHLCVRLPLFSGMQAEPLAHRPSLLTGTIPRLPHRLRAPCIRLTVRAPLLSATLPERPLHHRTVPTTVPYVLMFLHRWTLSVFQTVITLILS